MTSATARCALGALVYAAVTACSGATGPGPAAPRPGPDFVSVTIKIAIPSPPANSKNKQNFVSPATQSVAVTITPAGSPTGVTTVGNCSQGFCTQTVAAPIGKDTFAVALYSHQNATGSILSNGTTVATIVAGANNVVSITFDPVVQSASSNLAMPLGAGQATSVPISIAPLDPSGATIVGPGSFENAQGVPTLVSLSLTDPSGTTKLAGPTSFASPPPTGPYPVTLVDNGVPPNFAYPTLTTSVGGSVSSTTTIQLAPTQVGTPVPVSGGSIVAAAKGPDANLWFVLKATQSFSIGQFVASSGAIHLFPLPAEVAPSDLVTGGDGNLWFFDTGRTTFGQFSTTGLLRQYAAGFTASDLVRGVDGNIWFISSQSATPLGKIASDGTITTYAAGSPPPTELFGIAPGNSGRMYFLAGMSNGTVDLGSVAADGSGLSYTPTSLQVSGFPFLGLYASPDGNFYTIEISGSHFQALEQITPSGTVSQMCGTYEYNTVGSTLADGTLLFNGGSEPDGTLGFGAIRPNGDCVYAPEPLNFPNFGYPAVGLSVGFFYTYTASGTAIVRVAY